MCATENIIPVSLLASITVIKHVDGRMLSITEVGKFSTPRYVTSEKQKIF